MVAIREICLPWSYLCSPPLPPPAPPHIYKTLNMSCIGFLGNCCNNPAGQANIIADTVEEKVALGKIWVESLKLPSWVTPKVHLGWYYLLPLAGAVQTQRLVVHTTYQLRAFKWKRQGFSVCKSCILMLGYGSFPTWSPCFLPNQTIGPSESVLST